MPCTKSVNVSGCAGNVGGGARRRRRGCDEACLERIARHLNELDENGTRDREIGVYGSNDRVPGETCCGRNSKGDAELGCGEGCCDTVEEDNPKTTAGGCCAAETRAESSTRCQKKDSDGAETNCAALCYAASKQAITEKGQAYETARDKEDGAARSCCESAVVAADKATPCEDACCGKAAVSSSNAASARLDQLQSTMQQFEALLRLGQCLCRRMMEHSSFCCCCKDAPPGQVHHRFKSEANASTCSSGIVEDTCCSATKSRCGDTIAAAADISKASPAVQGESVTNKTGRVDVEISAVKTHVAFSVTGMTCTGCVRKLLNVLSNVPGISNPDVTFVSGMAAFDFDPSKGNIQEVLQLIEKRTGFKLALVDSGFHSFDLVLTKQAAEAYARNDHAGLESFEKVDCKNRYRITYDARVAGARSLLLYGAELAPPEPDAAHSEGRHRLLRMVLMTVISAIFTVPILVLSWSENPVPESTRQIISLILATFVQAVAVPEFYTGAMKSLIFSRVVEMDMLIVISVTAAYGYSIVAFALAESGVRLEQEAVFETSSLLITLVLLGRLMAAVARMRAVSAVSMSSLQGGAAILVQADGRTEEIDARLLHFEDVVRVPAHTSIVTDGVVVTGNGVVDESMYTGESDPVTKTEGDAVIAGTINGPTILDFKVTRLPDANSISDIKLLVQDALGSKPRVQDLADKVASCFIPTVCTIAVITFGIWIAVATTVRHENGGGAVGTAITYAIAVLAIACPCALGLAVPTVLVIASGVAARSGVVIRSADALERGWKTTDVVFDKTGTLTTAEFDVAREHLPASEFPEDVCIGLAKAVVQDNNHPVSIALSKHLKGHPVPGLKVQDLQSLPGSGIQGIWNGRLIRAGNPHWLSVANDPSVIDVLDRGLTAFCITVDSTLILAYGLQSTIRSEAKSVIATLSGHHGLRCHIVSGDSQKAVHAVATAVGINPLLVRAQYTPAQKKDYVSKLQSQNSSRVVLFCGDGTNDAVAVAEADIGMQIGSSPSDVTRSVCDVSLHSLLGIGVFLGISKRSFRRIVFNFVWSAVYNVVAILFASGALVRVRIPPAYAGLGEIVSVAPVVLAAASLLWSREGKRGRSAC